MPALMPPRLKMIRRRHRLETMPLRRHRELHQITRRELLSGGLVPETERKSHASILLVDIW